MIIEWNQTDEILPCHLKRMSELAPITETLNRNYWKINISLETKDVLSPRTAHCANTLLTLVHSVDVC